MRMIPDKKKIVQTRPCLYNEVLTRQKEYVTV